MITDASANFLECCDCEFCDVIVNFVQLVYNFLFNSYTKSLDIATFQCEKQPLIESLIDFAQPAPKRLHDFLLIYYLKS